MYTTPIPYAKELQRNGTVILKVRFTGDGDEMAEADFLITGDTAEADIERWAYDKLAWLNRVTTVSQSVKFAVNKPIDTSAVVAVPVEP